jgi:hypothetical protein
MVYWPGAHTGTVVSNPVELDSVKAIRPTLEIYP